MEKLVFLLLLFGLWACKSNENNSLQQEAFNLPYFQTPDFTPKWINQKTELDSVHALANFSFLNQNNLQISPKSFRGKIHVANFFFTVCPSLCPRLMDNMKVLQQAFKFDSVVVLASYSVTPERDNVAVLRKYANENGVVDKKWHLITGEKKMIYEIARKSYFADENIGVQKGENDFLHTENFILVDKDLHIRGVYNGTLTLEIEQIIKDIKALKIEQAMK